MSGKPRPLRLPGMTDLPKDQPVTVDDYIAAQPAAAQEHARELRAQVHALVPGAQETIRYGMPAFQAGGATFLYLGAWKRHVGLYPIYRGDEVFEALVAPYRSGKDSVRFPLGRPLPSPVIEAIVRTQHAKGAPNP